MHEGGVNRPAGWCGRNFAVSSASIRPSECWRRETGTGGV
jgi:hypothetical protein